VLAAYRPILARDRFPLVVLAADIPPADVDVNVHPTKAWVRFRHPRLVQEMLVAALHDALQRPTSVPAAVDWSSTATTAAAGEAVTAPGAQSALFAETAAPYTKAARFGRVLGQVQDTFIVATTDDEVFFLDQHVVHERVLFERLESDLAAGGAPSQALLFPDPVDLPPAARALLERWRAPLERLGFGFDVDRDGAVVVTAVPTLLKADEPRRLLEAAVDELGGPKAGEPAVDRALAFVACRAAIKAATPLAREEMERLVADLAQTRTPYFCPHGRPIVSRVSMHDIRRELKRTW
jgi:DNA mismatch repair protein MutL